MGLLDDLKQRADSVLLRQLSSETNRKQKLQQSHAHMKDALQYWLEFFKALNVLKPPVTRSYFIEGSTQLENLVQCDYNVNSRRVTVDHTDYLDSIELRFRCVSNEKITVEKESNAVVTRFREHLWQHGLKFDTRQIRREGAYVERGIFTIMPDVATTMIISAEADKDRIKVSVRNLERLGEYQYTYDYDEFGPALFDEMGKAILAEPNQLRRTGRHQAAASAAWQGTQRRATETTRAAPTVARG